jgi:WD40 repeat protein/class 3 adenylate cyclase
MDVVPDIREGQSRVVFRSFLIADIRGYSTFTRERGDETAARLAARFADLARDAVEARSGRVIELRGDEALAVFESTSQAVRAGLEFQEACREASDEDPELPLPVGIGIDRGEAVPVEDGYRGKALNLAARLCSKAAAGQVLVTRDVAELARDVAEVEFDSRGSVELKGFDRPVELLEVRSTRETPVVIPEAEASRVPLPPELDDAVPLADRDHELRWLRGTWRQARRGNGRVVFVSGPAGIGKTRFAAELAVYVQASGGAIRYAGSGGAGGAETISAIAHARPSIAPTLYVLDGLDLFGEAIAAIGESVEAIESHPILMLGLFRGAEGRPTLAELAGRIDVRGDGHRVLGPIGLDGVIEIARSYVGDVDEFPAESTLRASGGVPARVHQLVSEWARDEAKRRLTAAAEWFAAGKSKQAAGLDFANNVIALKLGRIYTGSSTEGRVDSCPYKGLAAFEESDAPYFYGRERLVGELAARTVGMGLLGVVGPSGSGKSSVVMAGLLPSLAAGLLPGSERWGHAIVRPGEHPMDALESTLRSCSPGERLVLVVDQFEEVFTTTSDESERSTFIDRLVELARDPEGAVVVVTIRGDYTDHCAPYTQLAELFASNLVLVGPMTSDELRRAVELPARRVGLRVESELADALVGEVAEEPGGLPLLSTALVELWQARDGGWLRHQTYERTGGVRSAVARLAEASYELLSPPERDTARAVLLRLVGDGEGEAAVRWRVPVSEFDIERDPTAASVLTRFTEDRLLTRDDGLIEIAHEALIREWPRLRGWLEEDATGRQLRTHLTRSAKQWSDRDRDAGDLYRGARLSATLDWAQTHDRELNELEREFLAQSRQASEREAERQRRTNRRLRGLLVGTAVFLVVALVAGSLALIQRGHARNAQSAAEAQALRSDAERVGALALTEPNLDRSFLLALLGVHLEDRPETRGDLLAVLQKTPALIRIVRPSQQGSAALAVSPDSRLLASADSEGVVTFYDLRTWKPSGAPVRLDEPATLNALVFSPDGRTLAVGTAAKNEAHLYLVDVSSRSVRRIGSWPSVPAWGALRFIRFAFAPDGKRIAVAVATVEGPPSVLLAPSSGRLILVDTTRGDAVWQRKYPWREGQQEVEVAFTPRGAILTSAWQGDTVLWDPKNGGIVRRFPIGGTMDISPDGRFAALSQNNEDSGNPSSSLAVLDLHTGTHRALDALPTEWIASVRFTPDGKSVLGRSFEGVLREWDVDSGAVVQTFTSQSSGGVGLNLAIAPDGRTALVGAVDGSVAAWDLSGTQRLAQTFLWSPPSSLEGCPTTPCFVVDRVNTIMASAQSDGTVSLVDLRHLRLVGTLPAKNGKEVDALAFFPDGRTLATGGTNGRVTLWDVRNRSVVRSLRFDNPVPWVAVSPDGHLLAVQTKSPDGTSSSVEVQDLSSGKVLFEQELENGKGSMYFSPDGRRLAALGCCEPASTIKVWNARTGVEAFSPQVDGHATSIAFSPDGHLLGAGTEDGRVVLWDARNGKQIGSPIEVATGPINPISFSRDGRLFVASSFDGTATVWDIASRKRLGNSFPIRELWIPTAYFVPSGDLVIDYGSRITVWPMDLRAWERFACQVAGRDLTDAEWRDLLPERPYRQVCPQ